MTIDDVLQDLRSAFGGYTIAATPGSDDDGAFDAITVDGEDAGCKWRQADVDDTLLATGALSSVNMPTSNVLAVARCQVGLAIFDGDDADFQSWIVGRGVSADNAEEFNKLRSAGHGFEQLVRLVATCYRDSLPPT